MINDLVDSLSSIEDQDLDFLVNDMFSYHEWTPEQIEKGNRIRDSLKVACKVILINIPPSSDRSTALRKLRECRMDCNAAITFNGKY